MLGNRVFHRFAWLLVAIICLSIAVAGQNLPEPYRHLVPPSQGVAPAIVIADSGPKLSGAGKQWSRWYRVGLGKAPTGYTLHRVEFWLSGDRSCGAGAECREILKNNRQVLWEFRLRGHQERGAPRQTYSVAHIRVLYRPE